jgi:hypothetical protein
MPKEPPGHAFYEKPPQQNPHESIEFKIPNRADYIAHQSYYIRRALERIADALEKDG